LGRPRLLDQIRRDEVWEKVKSGAKKSGIDLTFDVVKALAKRAIAAMLGMGRSVAS
jgi:hypothetical protein